MADTEHDGEERTASRNARVLNAAKAHVRSVSPQAQRLPLVLAIDDARKRAKEVLLTLIQAMQRRRLTTIRDAALRSVPERVGDEGVVLLPMIDATGELARLVDLFVAEDAVNFVMPLTPEPDRPARVRRVTVRADPRCPIAC